MHSLRSKENKVQLRQTWWCNEFVHVAQAARHAGFLAVPFGIQSNFMLLFRKRSAVFNFAPEFRRGRQQLAPLLQRHGPADQLVRFRFTRSSNYVRSLL